MDPEGHIADHEGVWFSRGQREGERVGMGRNASFCEGVDAVQGGGRASCSSDEAEGQEREEPVWQGHREPGHGEGQGDIEHELVPLSMDGASLKLRDRLEVLEE